jgi:hypothetical protein
MADRYVKHKTTGLVLIYAPPWDTDPEFEECADAAGTPIVVDPEQPTYEAAPTSSELAEEQGAAPAVEAEAKPARTRTRSNKAAAAPSEAEAALQSDASRGL